MKLKILLAVVFIFLSNHKINSQNKDIQIAYDSFLRLGYDADQIVPNKEDLKVLDNISKLILENKIPANFYFYWQVEYLRCEKEKDSLIEYKRLDYIFNYFEENYNIKREIFKTEFYESEYCTNSTINFTIIKP